MPLSLHAAVIPNWLQMLGAVEHLVGKAEEFVQSGSASESDLLEVRLADDMLPLGYQIKSCWTHSKLALEGVRKGIFHPHMDPWPPSLSALRALIVEARQSCETADEAELEAIAGNPMRFEIKDRLQLDFTVQDFLLSFTQPNLYFHATTAYDILRKQGLAIGKTDYLGRMRLATG